MTKQTKREPGWMPTYRGDHLDDRERELDRIESSWADWTHGLRTGARFIRDGSQRNQVPVADAIADIVAWIEARRNDSPTADEGAGAED